ncbi:EF-hand calcium-binding domain-containing protein 2 [Channa argus]|uniref:EF-hand calcium-binding domain-containing protein 2 n=1 Tax=Channa argus TaxID=215402 RepID=A0A6G1P7N9_CHAAH|nr:EF-hand calcium-binding domain-containing protein 2 [Channa argus]
MAEDEQSSEGVVPDVHKKIKAAFEAFDYEFNNTVDVRFPPIPEDHLLQAFEVLDKDKKGYLEPEELTKYMTKEGEPFTQEEMDEMLTALVDHEKNRVYYKDLINQLTVDPDM